MFRKTNTILKFIIIQISAPDYRTKFYNHLFKGINKLKLYCGEYHYPKSIITDKQNKNYTPVKNIFLLGHSSKLVFQVLPFINCLKAKVVVLEFNPRILSNWIILILRKLTFNKTYVWGHAWARNGRGSKSERIRYLMKYMSSGIIVYTQLQQKELQIQMPFKNIMVASNALYYSNEMHPKQIVQEKCNNYIYVGRLVKDKKPAIMIEAFARAFKHLPTDCKLFVIGDGPERVVLEELAKSYQLEERIIFKGHISDYEILKEYYAKSIASISPGYLGLSVTQSLGFGVPIIVSKNESHSPEIEALVDNENYAYFETDNIESLSKQFINFNKNKAYWFERREVISDKCRKQYSIERMVEPFIKIFSE